MTKFYYVEAIIEKTDYMQDAIKIDYRNIVLADNQDQAVEILEAYWNSQNDPYNVYYYILNYDIKEALH